MSEPIDIKAIKEKLATGSSVFVLFGNQANVDQVAAALSLFLTLKQQGKEVLIASPAEMRAEFSRLVGLNDITKTIGNKNLVISFGDFDFDSIDKISHNDGTGGHFELVIQPKAGLKAPNPKNIEFSFRGSQADLVFLVGINRLEDLGAIYESERALFTSALTVAFNRRPNTTIATVNIVDEAASSLSEIVCDFIEQLGTAPKGDIATNLLTGLDFATNRFQNPMISGTAFITAGKLINNGARRQPPRPDMANNGANGKPTFMPFTPPMPNPFQGATPQVPPFLPLEKPANPNFKPPKVHTPPFIPTPSRV